MKWCLRCKYRLIVVLAAMSLVACQQKSSESTAKASNETSTSPANAPTRMGPHGSYDPHYKLTAEKHIQVALKHRDENRIGEALDELQRAIEKFDKEARLYSVRASILMEKGELSSALRDLEKSLELNPDDPSTLTNRAQAYRSFGRIAEALNDLNKAIEKDPDFIAARFNRGAIYYSSGEYKKALKDFNHSIAVDPHTEALYFNRASVYDALGKKKLAITDLKHFIQLSKNESWIKTANELLNKWQATAAEDSKQKS